MDDDYEMDSSDETAHGPRVQVEYTAIATKKILRARDRFNSYIEDMEDESSQPLLYDNHRDLAARVYESLANRDIFFASVIGKTQSGKTSGMLAIIREYVLRELIELDNIYIISGLASTDWQVQTTERMPKCLHGNIYHNGQLKHFKESVKGKKNVLVIIDEGHMASKDIQTINKMFKELEWTLARCLEDDIKLVTFSATPDGVAFAKKNWPKEKTRICTHLMKPGVGYFGTKEMNERGQIHQAMEMHGTEEEVDKEWVVHMLPEIISNWLYVLDNHSRFTTPKYILLRMNSKYDEEHYLTFVNETLKKHFQGDADLFDTEDWHSFHLEGDLKGMAQLNELLSTPPKKHTFIFIKEMLKCAQTIVKSHIGSMIDRPTINDSFITQSLAGRATGYCTHDILVYSCVETLQTYEKMWNSKFDDIDHFPWKSNTTVVKRGRTIAKDTYASAKERCDVEEELERPVGSTPVIKFRIHSGEVDLCLADKENMYVLFKAYKPADAALYASYVRHCWHVLSDDSFKKYGLIGMSKPGAYSTTTNITSPERNKNVLMIYRHENVLYINAWNGEAV